MRARYSSALLAGASGVSWVAACWVAASRVATSRVAASRVAVSWVAAPAVAVPSLRRARPTHARRLRPVMFSPATQAVSSALAAASL